MPLADGQVYAGYTILRKLGEGGGVFPLIETSKY